MKPAPDTSDRLIAELRAQAAAFNPEPPAGARRRVLSALAVERPDATVAPWARWSIGAAACAVVIVAILLATTKPRPPGPTIVRGPEPTPARSLIPRTSLAVADPLSLAHRFIDRPMEAEVESLLAGLTRTRDTVVRVLPAPVERPPGDAAAGGGGVNL